MRINLFWGIFLLIILGCESEQKPNSLEGKFTGAWASTRWTYKFYSNHNFDFKSEGHFGFVEAQGKYRRVGDSLFLTINEKSLIQSGVVNPIFLIDGDSCIIDDYLRFDYCKTRDWSKKRSTKYPQIKAESSALISDFESILQQILASEEIKQHFIDTSKNLVLEEYFEININYHHQLECFGKPVIIKNSQEIESEKIRNYIRINDTNINSNTTVIYLNVNSVESKQLIIATFKKENGKWRQRSMRQR